MGRGSAGKEMSKMVFYRVASVILVLVILVVLSDAASYTVGDGNGWSFAVGNWPVNKTFHAGDELTFNYVRPFHNVVKVNRDQFNDCTAPDTALVRQSGSDRVTLTKGSNYYICTIPFHCNLGMKIAVYAN